MDLRYGDVAMEARFLEDWRRQLVAAAGHLDGRYHSAEGMPGMRTPSPGGRGPG